MRQRLAPFLDLLDVRYLPLLAVIAPQSYTVYAWLLGDGAPAWVAALGGFGFEAVYVGAVAWAERGTGWSAARPPAVTALLFSVAVSVAHYAPHVGALAILHAGFPIVAYAYTVTMHTHTQRTPKADAGAPAPKSAALLTHSCPQCGAALTQSAYASACRYGHCSACKAHTNGHRKEEIPA